MTKKTKSDENKTQAKNGSNFLRNFIFIILLFFAGFMFIKLVKPELLDVFVTSRGISESNELVEESALEDSLTIAEVMQEEYSVGPEPPLLSFAPDEEELVEEELELYDPYEEQEDNRNELEKSRFLGKTLLIKDLNSYRLFLENVSKLLTKFEADQDYTIELEKLEKVKLPANIEKIITQLKLYNKQTANDSSIISEIEPFDSKLLAKFIKIKKLPSSIKEQKQLRNKIREQLPLFTKYIYSSELQEIFMNK